MKTFELEGTNFKDLNEFYDEVERVLCPGFPFGRNLDALNDALVGGLSEAGVEYNQPTTIVWKDSANSERELGEQLFTEIVKMMKGHGHQLSLV